MIADILDFIASELRAGVPVRYIHPSYSSLIAAYGDTEELYAAFRTLIGAVATALEEA